MAIIPTADVPVLLSLEDLNRYFFAVGIRWECNVCGKTDWAIVSPGETETENNFAVAMPVVQKDGGILSAHFRFIVLACTNCQNARIHVYKPIKAWIESNPAEPQSNVDG